MVLTTTAAHRSPLYEPLSRRSGRSPSYRSPAETDCFAVGLVRFVIAQGCSWLSAWLAEAVDLRQLQALVAVIDHGSFSAAARATHTVQSNISTHVARLEQELHAVLIDRSTGLPTEEGESVARRARHIQNELVSLEADVASMRGSPRGEVKIGIVGTTARWLAPLLADRLVETAPEVGLIVVDATTTSQVVRLIEGDLHVGLIALPIGAPEIATTPLFAEDYLLIAPPNHPLATMPDPITVHELAQHELLLAAPGTTFRREIDKVFSAHDLQAKAKIEVDGIRLLASLAFSGFGAAITPATAAPGWIGGDWVRKPIEGLGRRTIGLARRKRGTVSAATEAVIAAVTESVSREAGDRPGLHCF